ncbi:MULTISPECIES: Ig-like domain-containing alpha-2-macroglobulin family protein [unclassified Fusibacter]|uniref:Ig-like domain-containing alpha-2-macroglobulin family protein n=1 Tax=unclassified Fusibacter TaxID=2624464 RepID=UPI001012DC83|nr:MULTISPECIES: BatD family protein [unclassified Fusibacter]MCK8060350.1 BatD family protein [Fusibacter sp. A2]NPE20361.1 hypothetical protein [Fusibacter sp. A1]RXV63567.1 hypothetical protein DWB64_00915 [Fusibacter sp. A1]
MDKKRIALIMTAVLIALMAGIWMLNREKEGTGQEVQIELPPDRVDISKEAVDILSVEALDAVDGLISEDTSFLVTADTEIDDGYLATFLSITPAVEYQVERTSDLSVLIKPVEPLDAGTVIKFRHNNKTRTAGWSFEVGGNLKVVGTYPARHSSSVPPSSGIEISFSQVIDESILEFITIEPEIEYSHRIDKNTLILMPTSLDLGCTYQVKVRDGFISQVGSLLASGYAFDFTTGESGNFGYEQAKMSLVLEGDAAVLEVPYEWMPSPESVQLYRMDEEGYRKATANYLADSKYYSHPGKRMDESVLEPIDGVEVSAFERSYSIFGVLDGLDKGYYLAKFSARSNTYYQFFQVTNLNIYIESTEDDALLWCIDTETGQMIDSAKIIVDGALTGETGSDGTAYVELDSTDAAIVVETTDERVHLPYRFNRNYYWYDYSSSSDKNETPKGHYFLYSDRSVYQDGDMASFFGMVHLLGQENPASVELVLFNDHREEVDRMTSQVSDFGTYGGSFELNKRSEYRYELEVTAGEVVLDTLSVGISTYVKPEFIITTELEKEVLGPGESTRLYGTVTYYDETPTSLFELNTYSGKGYWERELGSEKIVTDTTGSYDIQYTPKYWYETSKPFMFMVETTNKKAENTDVADHDMVQIFPSEIILDATSQVNENEDQLIIEVTSHKLKLPTKQLMTDDSKLYSGEPLDIPIHVIVEETYYEAITLGTSYNPLTKEMETKYDYSYRRAVVYDGSLITEDGLSTIGIDYVPGRNYSVKVTTMDTPDHMIQANTYVYGTHGYIERYEAAPRFKALDSVKLNERFTLELDLPENVLKSRSATKEKTLFVVYKNGYREHQVNRGSTYSEVFTEEDVSNVLIRGIYFDGSKFRIGEYPPTISVMMDPEEKKLDLTITTDRNQYKPGEEITVEVVSKIGETGVKSRVLINMMDEAYYALYPDNRKAYQEFYDYDSTAGYPQHYHTGYITFPDMAEMGEGGSDDYYIRENFKDTAAFIEIQTDQNGIGKASFTLPDSTTKWRITTHGISGERFIGTATEQVVSTLPFYSRMILQENYLTGEKADVVVRAGGEAIDKDTSVTYKLNVNPPTGPDYTLDGTELASEYTSLAMKTLEPGRYEVTLFADTDTYKDAVLKTFEVVDSKVEFSAMRRLPLSDTFTLTRPEKSSYLRIINTDARELHEELLKLLTYPSKRAEWALTNELIRIRYGGMYSTEILQTPYLDTLDPFTYYGGGISILENAEDDLQLTTDIAVIAPEYLDKQSTIEYFQRVLNEEELSTLDRLYAIWGLAALDEPVVHKLNLLLGSDEANAYTASEKVILACALTESGMIEKSALLYEELQKDIGSNGKWTELDQRVLLHLAGLASELKLNDATGWFERATANLPKEHVMQLLMMRYYQYQDKDLRPVVFDVLLNGVTEHVSHKAVFAYTLPLSVEPKIEFSNISGPGEIEEYYVGNLYNVDFSEKGGYKIVKTLDRSEVGLSEEIVVEIEVTKPSMAYLTVIESVPSGFSVVMPRSQMNATNLYFHFGGEETKKTFTYTIRAKQTGTFKLEPSVLSTGDHAYYQSNPFELKVK